MFIALKFKDSNKWNERTQTRLLGFSKLFDNNNKMK